MRVSRLSDARRRCNRGAAWPAAVLASLVLVLLYAAGCAGNSPALNSTDDAVLRAAAEAAALPTPAGVRPELMAQLKAEWLRAIADRGAAKQASWGEAMFYGEDRARLSYDPDTRTLSWRYGLYADLNLDGIVSVADLTPLAVHFGAVTDDGVGDDAAEAWADADKNGTVALADVAILGAYYRGSIQSYTVLGADDLNQGYDGSGLVTLAEVAPGARLPGYPPHYELVLAADAPRFICLRVEPVMDGVGGKYWIDLEDPLGALPPPNLFTDPRTGAQYQIIDGRVILQFKVSLDDPLVAQFLLDEQLTVAWSIPELRAMEVYLPEGTSVAEAVGTWLDKYPQLLEIVQPCFYYEFC